jgi:prepilin-type processing-associated H-X9-DG protein
VKRWRLRVAQAGAVALLAALVATTVSTLRESSRHHDCAKNLRQIGLGLRVYSERIGSFPYGAVPNAGLAPENRQSWILAVLPDMLCTHCWGLDELGKITPSMSCDDAAMQRAAVVPLGPVLCPSASFDSVNGPQSLFRTVDRSKSAVPSTYVGLAGLGKDAAYLPGGDSHAGVFGFNRVTRPRDITDGMSTTLMVVETSDLRTAWVAGGEATIRGVDPARRPYIGKGRPFGGNHPGKALVLFADGSVRDVQDTIAPEVFEPLSTIAGDEPLPPDWENKWTAQP